MKWFEPVSSRGLTLRNRLQEMGAQVGQPLDPAT